MWELLQAGKAPAVQPDAGALLIPGNASAQLLLQHLLEGGLQLISANGAYELRQDIS